MSLPFTYPRRKPTTSCQVNVTISCGLISSSNLNFAASSMPRRPVGNLNCFSALRPKLTMSGLPTGAVNYCNYTPRKTHQKKVTVSTLAIALTNVPHLPLPTCTPQLHTDLKIRNTRNAMQRSRIQRERRGMLTRANMTVEANCHTIPPNRFSTKNSLCTPPSLSNDHTRPFQSQELPSHLVHLHFPVLLAQV